MEDWHTNRADVLQETGLIMYNLIQMAISKFSIINHFEMGSQMQRAQSTDLSEYAPPFQQYSLTHSGPNYFSWQHRLLSCSLLQFPITITTDQQLKQQLELYLFRYRHPLLVSALYFKRNGVAGKASVFYQRVFTNLGRIKDIPFGDSLQFYYVGLRGFQMLWRRFGYFQVQEDMFHITHAKNVKIWCHKDISKHRPTQQQQQQGSESEMVRKIITIIEQNSDPSSHDFSIGAEIYEKASHTFAAAIQKFREICFKHNYVIPDKLSCLDLISKGDVGILLDQYGQTQNPIIVQVENQAVNHRPLANLDLFTIKNENSGSSFHSTIPLQPNIEQNEMVQTRTRNKGKGLQVSHSLQRLRQPNRNCNSHILITRRNQPPIPNQRTLQSPIKQLEQQSINLAKGNILHRMTHSPQIIHDTRAYQPNPQPPIPHQRFFVNPTSLPPNSQFVHARVPGQIIRSNSFDNVNQGPFMKNSKTSDYKIVVNGIVRPTSSIASTTQSLNHKNPPKPPPNPNFLSIYALSPSPSPTPNHRPIQPIPPSPQNESFKQHLNTFQIPNRNDNSQFLPPPPPQLKYRSTFISNLSEFDNGHLGDPLKEKNNLKSRFEEYKRNFHYDKYQKENRDEAKFFSQNNNNQNKLQRPFFGGILNSETVNSYIESNGFQEKRSEIEKTSQKSVKIEANEFPSITDVSDNISSFPNRQKPLQSWREESVVVKHDPNDPKMNMPEIKKYEPNIDRQIWADMLKARNRAKLANCQN